MKPIDFKVNFPLHFTGKFDWFEDKIIFAKETPYEVSLYDYNGNLIMNYLTDKSILKKPRIIKKGAGFILPGWDRVIFVGNVNDRYVLTQLQFSDRGQIRTDLFDIESGKMVATRIDPEEEAIYVDATNGNKLYASSEASGYPEVEVLTLEIR